MTDQHTKPVRPQVPPPAAWRLLFVPVAITVLVVFVVLVITLLRFNDLLSNAQSADPSTSRAALIAQIWGRVAFGCILAVSWPLSLRLLSRGSTMVYARCRRVSVLAALILLAITLFSSGPAWLHAAHGTLAACEIGIFAATMHPQMRAWYAKNRRTKRTKDGTAACR